MSTNAWSFYYTVIIFFWTLALFPSWYTLEYLRKFILFICTQRFQGKKHLISLITVNTDETFFLPKTLHPYKLSGIASPELLSMHQIL